MPTPVLRSGHAATAIARLEERPLDVLVIGGGIVGAGVVRDAAMRGLRAGLVEQNDFASGTSSRSSRLLHGGIRYLAQGRVGLVREASKEKSVLRRIAPHLSDPLQFIFPTRKAGGWPRWKLAVGVRIYDWLCGLGKGGGSGSMGVRETLKRVPGLTDNQLTGAVRYYDALTNDARLVIDTLRSAAKHGGIVANYVRLADATQANGLWRCQLEDTQTGQSFSITAKAVVNATGPWSDRLPHSKTSLRLTKGVHLVIDRRRLPMDDALVLAEGDRILFAIPWGDRLILGTTDTDYQGPLENPPCDDADVAYILKVVNDAFPAARLTPADVVSTWSGLRPLVADPNGNPSDISRRHKVAMSQPGWWDITGGKLTTYRLMAEEAVDHIVKEFGLKAAPCRTATTPLLTVGGVANAVSPIVGGVSDADPAASGILPPPVTAAAVAHYCRDEWARRLDDVMIRRTSWRHYHHNQYELAVHVAQWMAKELHWSDAQRETELRNYRKLVGVADVPAPHIQHGHSTNGHVQHVSSQIHADRQPIADSR